MSEDGGSDLDVFENVSKAPLSARKKTLVGLAVPQGSAPALSSSGRASVPPPPPPSLRTSVPPPEPLVFADGASIDDTDEIEEVDAVEELSSPLAAEAPDEATAPLGDVYESDDATQVFSGFGSSPEASEDPPTPMLTLGSAPMGPSLPPPPPPPSRSSIPQPPPPPFATAPSLPPPPPPPRPSGAPIPAPSTPSAGDWDEDDDKTSIFNRESGFDAAHMLMGTSQVGSVPIGSVPDAPPPPMSRPSAPIPSPPVMSMPAPRMAVPVLAPDSMPPAPTNRTPMVLVALALVLGAALFLLLRPTTGGLVVTVAGPGNRPLEGVEVLVDGKLLCSASPCTLADLPAGTHMVQARAKGYSQTAETAVIVTSGQDAVHNIRLAQAAGTGLRVAGTGAGLRLRVDGKEIGPLPQELGSLSPGVHEVEVVSDHFETWRRSITVTEEEMQNVEVPKLKVIKGLAVIKAGSGGDGARVVLESNGDRRVLPSLPMNLHIDTSKPHQLIASRAGYDTVRQDIVFEDGQAERVFEISFAKAPEPSTEPPRTGGGRRVAPTGPAPSPAPAPEPAAPKSGEGVLNINSIPASNILLDGRPVGRTPKLGLKVPAGKHTVVFILEGQRENKSVNVVAGQTATVTHRF